MSCDSKLTWVLPLPLKVLMMPRCPDRLVVWANNYRNMPTDQPLKAPSNHHWNSNLALLSRTMSCWAAIRLKPMRSEGQQGGRAPMSSASGSVQPGPYLPHTPGRCANCLLSGCGVCLVPTKQVLASALRISRDGTDEHMAWVHVVQSVALPLCPHLCPACLWEHLRLAGASQPLLDWIVARHGALLCECPAMNKDLAPLVRQELANARRDIAREDCSRVAASSTHSPAAAAAESSEDEAWEQLVADVQGGSASHVSQAPGPEATG